MKTIKKYPVYINNEKYTIIINNMCNNKHNNFPYHYELCLYKGFIKTKNNTIEGNIEYTNEPKITTHEDYLKIYKKYKEIYNNKKTKK